MASKKPPQQIAKAKTDSPRHSKASSDRNSSPFWPNRPSNGRTDSQRSGDSKIVIGASYSHTDILKFDSLSLGSSASRPHTPPSSSKSATKDARIPPNVLKSTSSPGQKRPEPWKALSSTSDDWNLNDDDRRDQLMTPDTPLDEDGEEDEFGLPSISRDTKRRTTAKLFKDPGGGKGGGFNGSFYNLEPARRPGRARANSSDIALERGLPSYPVSRGGDGKILRPQYKDILKDPANALHLITHPPTPKTSDPKETEAHATRLSRINKFKRILQATNISLGALRDCAWSGIPAEVRAMSWQILLGYLPTSSERRVTSLERKRKAYLDAVTQAFPSVGGSSATAMKPSQADKTRSRGLDEALWHQISIDVPRTSPHLQLYSYEATQRSLERILYVWAIRHPASGYVQGINDLLTPFWQVFLGSYITDYDVSSGMDPGQLPRAVLDAVEADSFWCLTKLLEGIQDNYIHAQPGIVRQVSALKDLTKRIDGSLAKHLESEGVEFMQFSFRWMNCLLMRELTVNCIIRMWDTYMAEEQGFSDFHLYVCAAFLVKWSEQLLKMEFQDIMMFLQSLPTKSWNEKDIELLLSEAYIWQSLFRGSAAHLRDSTSAS